MKIIESASGYCICPHEHSKVAAVDIVDLSGYCLTREMLKKRCVVEMVER